jgi:FkbM family methyltransferase
MTTQSQMLDDVFRNDPAKIVRQAAAAMERRLNHAPAGLLLYGAGHYGRVAAAALRSRGMVAKAFIDRDSRKAGGECAGIPIIGLDTVHADQLKTSLVVVTVYNCVPVLQELTSRGIDAITYAQLAVAIGEPLLPFCGIQDPAILWHHESAVRTAMALWADEESRQEYVAQLMWSLHLDPMTLPAPRPATDTYFEPSLVDLRSDEVFIDCGAFDGDSVAAFRDRCPNYKALIALEPDPTNRSHFIERFGGQAAMTAARISVLPYAASDRRETVTFDVTGTAGSAIANTGLQVEAATLDDLVADHAPTFLKMDIEGAEPKALAGASAIMRVHKPRLAVCLYHDRRHLWEIPLQIAESQPAYRLNLRRYADECWELICYADALSSGTP